MSYDLPLRVVIGRTDDFFGNNRTIGVSIEANVSTDSLDLYGEGNVFAEAFMILHWLFDIVWDEEIGTLTFVEFKLPLLVTFWSVDDVFVSKATLSSILESRSLDCTYSQ